MTDDIKDDNQEPRFVVVPLEHVDNFEAAATFGPAVRAARINAEEHGGRYVILKRIAVVEVCDTKVTGLDPEYEKLVKEALAAEASAQ